MITPHGPVTVGEITDGAVSTAKIADDAVTPAKVSVDIVAGVAADYKIARGVLTTGGATDTVATGLTTVVAAVASLEDDPTVDNTAWVTCAVGNQTDAPIAGSIVISGWIPTAAGDATPKAAATHGKKVGWIAVGT
jgi:hypothetical protein